MMNKEVNDFTPELTRLAHAESTRLFDLALASTDKNNEINPEGLVERSEIYRSAGRLDEAWITLNQSSRPGWTTVPEFVALADAMTKAERNDDSLEVLRQGLELAPHIPPDRDGDHINRGYDALTFAFAERGEVELAFKAIEHAKRYPDSKYHSNMINSIIAHLAKNGHLQKAFDIIDTLSDDEQKYAYGYMAHASARRGDFETVDRLKREGLMNNLFQLASSVDRAEYHLEKGELDEARSVILQAAEIREADFNMISWRYRLIRLAFEKLGDIDLAKQLIKQMPDPHYDTRLLADIIKIQIKNDQREEALVTLGQIEEKARTEETEHNKFSVMLTRAQIANFRLQLGQSEEAKKTIDILVQKLDQLDTYEQWRITEAIFKLKNKELLTYFLPQLKEPPRWTSYYLAEIEIEEGNDEEGVIHLDTMVETLFNIDPNLPEKKQFGEILQSLYYSLDDFSELYIKANRPDKARSLIDRYHQTINNAVGDENKFYKNNCLLRVLDSALKSDNLDMAEQAISEISSPFTKSHAQTKLASRLIETGSYDQAIQALKAAEKLARHKSEYISDNNRAYLDIANTYLLLEITLNAASKVTPKD